MFISMNNWSQKSIYQRQKNKTMRKNNKEKMEKTDEWKQKKGKNIKQNTHETDNQTKEEPFFDESTFYGI